MFVAPGAMIEPLECRLCFSAAPVVSHALPMASAAAVGAKARIAPAWATIDDFTYQLQNVNLAAMGRSGFDLAVIDYSRDGSDAQRFTRSQIRALQHSPGGEKRVLAYLSIGEAENYRWYWQQSWDANGDGQPDAGAPAWLGPVNPDWPGNYSVKYWDPQWQRIVMHYVDKIVSAEFDGIYLDVVDAFEYWGLGGKSGLERASAAREMIDFVKAIASHARRKSGRGDFAVFVQNGEALGRDRGYLASITGIGREDVWYNGDSANAAADVRKTVAWLDRFRKAGKLVLCIDYVRRPALIDRFYANARHRGFVPYATTRDLDQLTINPGHAPD